MDRETLIARTAEGQGELARLHRQAAAAEARIAAATGRPRDAQIAHLQQLQAHIDALIAEEHRLRLQIDRAR